MSFMSFGFPHFVDAFVSRLRCGSLILQALRFAGLPLNKTTTPQPGLPGLLKKCGNPRHFSLTSAIRYAIMFGILERYVKRRFLQYGGREKEYIDVCGIKEAGR